MSLAIPVGNELRDFAAEVVEVFEVRREKAFALKKEKAIVPLDSSTSSAQA